MPGRVRRQFTPSGLSVPCLGSVIRPLATTPTVFDTSASYPAGAFHTPRLVSSRAITPATKPDGGITRGSPVAGPAGRRDGERCTTLPPFRAILPHDSPNDLVGHDVADHRERKSCWVRN